MQLSDLQNTADDAHDDGTDAEQADDSTTTEPESFPREYVKQLRDENAKHRMSPVRSDELANRLHAALVTVTGRLADPSDLAFDESHLDDPAALEAAIGQLGETKPHLASRRPAGDVGTGSVARTV